MADRPEKQLVRAGGLKDRLQQAEGDLRAEIAGDSAVLLHEFHGKFVQPFINELAQAQRRIEILEHRVKELERSRVRRLVHWVMARLK